MTAEGSQPADTDSDVPEDVKDRFKEALERKKGQAAGRNAAGATTGQKIHGAHGPESHQKTFRRKSGG